MNFGEQLVRIRRMLRDPQGKIWSRSLIIDTYNDVQKEVQVKTKFLEDIEVLQIPPPYDIAYTHDWEWRYIPSEYNRKYRCLRYSEQGGFAFCHRFESEIYFGNESEVADEGEHFTHPWEAYYCSPLGEPIRMKFPSDFHSTVYIAYDREPIDYLEKKAIQRSDQSYVRTEGTPIGYYRESDLDNEFVLYPKPQSNFPDETEVTHVYTHSWETGYIEGDSEQIGYVDNSDRTYLYVWESGIAHLEDGQYRAMFQFELNAVSGSVALYTDGDSESDLFGILTQRSGDLLSEETGFSADILDDQNNVVLVYKAIGQDIESDSDESNFPKFLRKYIEYGVLEQCYGANTDGKIASLAEYWRLRHMSGIEMIKRFMGIRRQDRLYQLRTSDRSPPRNQRHPRLPSNYPPI